MKADIRFVLAAAALLLCSRAGAVVVHNPFPVAPGDILFTEFFDGWHKLDPNTNQVTQLPWPDSSVFTGFLQFDAQGRVLYDDLADGATIHRLNPYNGQSVNLQVPGISLIDGFVIDAAGDLLIANSGEVSRHNLTTHQTTVVTDGTFFSPGGIASGDGRVFITEFFEDLWEIDPAGPGRTDLSDGELSIPGLIAVRSDGDLIVENFSPSVFYRINPDTLQVTLFSDDLPTFVNGMALDAQDNLWVTSTDGVFKYNSTGGAKTLVYDETFFNPAAIAVVPLDWNPVSIPESSTLLTGAVALLCLRLRTSPRVRRGRR